jgi:hypothetical protein
MLIQQKPPIYGNLYQPLSLKKSSKMDVKIRYNTDFPIKSPHKWRLLVDDVQHLVDAIEINCKCHTTDDIIKIDGEEKMKFHVSCKAKTVSFLTKKEIKKAIVS